MPSLSTPLWISRSDSLSSPSKYPLFKNKIQLKNHEGAAPNLADRKGLWSGYTSKRLCRQKGAGTMQNADWLSLQGYFPCRRGQGLSGKWPERMLIWQLLIGWFKISFLGDLKLYFSGIFVWPCGLSISDSNFGLLPCLQHHHQHPSLKMYFREQLFPCLYFC